MKLYLQLPLNVRSAAAKEKKKEKKRKRGPNQALVHNCWIKKKEDSRHNNKKLLNSIVQKRGYSEWALGRFHDLYN